MGMFILRRVGVLILTSLCLTFVVFFLTNLYPNLEKLAKTQGNFRMTDEEVATYLNNNGYLQPVFAKYGQWLGVLPGYVIEGTDGTVRAKCAGPDEPLDEAPTFCGVLQGNWGYSTVFRDDAGGIIAEKLALTGFLMFWVMLLMVPSALILGVLAGMREGSRADRTLSTVAITTTATPEYVSGVIFIAVFASTTIGLKWFKGTATSAMDGANFENFFLPVLTIALYGMGYIARMTRASMAEVMTAQYVRTARLKGGEVPQYRSQARPAKRADRPLHGDHASVPVASERGGDRRDPVQLQGFRLGPGASRGQQRHRAPPGRFRRIGLRRAGDPADL